MRFYSNWIVCTLVATAPIFAQTPLSIATSSPLPTGTVGTSYSLTFTTAGNGTPPYTWSVVSTAGALPPGLSLSSGGTLSGTPTQAGTFNFTVQVNDNGRQAPIKGFSLTIQPPPLVIQNSSPAPPGVVGVAYQDTYTATGGTSPYTWVLYSGNLPAGLTLASNGVLSGTPTTPATSTFTLEVTESPGPQGSAPRSTTKTFTLRVTLPITITTPSPINATVGVSSTTVMTATGGAPPFLWQLTGTGLPTWLKFDSASPDFLTGTPPTAGTFNFTVKATDSIGNTATKPFSMVVSAASALAITTTSLSNGSVGAAYSATLAASGGTTPYTWSIDPGGSLPAGLTLNATTGAITGTPTAAGTSNITVRVTDNAKATVTKQFSITITGGTTTGGPLVSTSTLDFSALVGGDTPAPQNFSLISTGQPLTFTVQVDGGSAGTPAPSWIGGRPVRGSTPGRFSVSVDQAGLAPGKYTARVLINTSDNKQTIVTVNLTVEAANPQLDVAPNFLRYGGTPNPSGVVEQNLLVRNVGGGGSFNFTATLVQGSAWMSLSPTSGTVSANSPVRVKVLVNTQNLSRIPLRGLIRFQSSAGNEDIPVSLIVRDTTAPVMDLNVNGLRFEAREGNGNSNTRNVRVLNVGSGTVNWKADLLAGADWITLQDTSGSSTPTSSSQLGITVSPNALHDGNYYGLVRIVDPNAAASPQYLPIYLVVKDAADPATPDPSPSGLFFVARAGGTAPAAQNIRLFTSSTVPVPFQVSGNVSDTLGAGWLSVTPTSGTTSTNAVAQVSVTVNPAGLPPGLYSGDITIAFSSTLIRTTNITLVVQPASAAAASDKAKSAVGCNPSRLSLTQTGTVNSFAAPAGWPTPLIVRLADDCGDPVLNGQVVATFSNGDPALAMRLTVPENGLYSATWSPSRVASSMTITARAAAPSLQAATAEITGSVTENKAPVLSPNGVVNNLFIQPGAPLAPGMVAALYGSGLASSTVEPGVIPLPKEFNGTRVLIGALQASLYFLSDGQLNIQLPTELQTNKEYSVVVATPFGITLPDTITLADAQPGVVAFPDGRVVAQHSDSTASLITASSPARTGEVITMYLVGMGPTDPAVASSSPAPGVEPLARVVNKPTINIGGKDANILYAGLTPFAVGLYQATIVVPDGISGAVPVVITQNGIDANPTTLPVR